MATTNDLAVQTSRISPPNRARSDNQRGNRGGWRGRGGPARGGSVHTVTSLEEDGPSNEGRGGRRGRGRGGNRGAQANSGRSNSTSMNVSDLTSRFSQTSLTNKTLDVTQRLTERPNKSEGEPGVNQDDDIEAEVCFICASPVEHHSVAPCNHRTCHICALRMRALYKNKDCAHCRTESKYVIFTDDATKRYEDFTAADLVNTDENIGIKYESNDIVEDTILLLRYNCPDPSCDVACLGWPDLHRHVKSVHHKKMCDLCTRNKKVFTHEHELFTDKELERHMKKGDDNPGAIDQSGFKGHPLCGFCGQRFYGDDELFVHCREKHERCFLCDRTSGLQPQYYINYDSLLQHFKNDHFLCPERECLEKKFVVFSSEIDLKAHQLAEHGNTLSKDVRRDARMVDLSSLANVRTPYYQERQGGGTQREGRGRGRGRDPNTEPIPASSAQPLRRDEQAFQRQMAIQSAQSVSTRTFGGQLTSAPATRGPQNNDQGIPSSHPSPNIESTPNVPSSLESSQDSNLTPQEQARRLRHVAVIERATRLLQNDDLKLSQFRSAISSYRQGAISAGGLIDSFFALFSDTSSNALGSLIREVADLYEDEAKGDALRTAWNNWRAINEDYPSLPGPSGMSESSLPLGWAQITASTPSTSTSAPPKSTSRVLRLKSSTAQSSRSTASRDGSWSATSPAATAFPGLPSPAATAVSSRAPSARPASTPSWATGIASSPLPGSARPTPPTSRPASRGPTRNVVGSGSDAFPALPPAAKPTSTIFGYGTGMVRRDLGGSTNNSSFSWGSNGNTSGSTGTEAGDADGNLSGQGRKKGNKGKKQVLVQWG